MVSRILIEIGIGILAFIAVAYVNHTKINARRGSFVDVTICLLFIANIGMAFTMILYGIIDMARLLDQIVAKLLS